MAGLRINSVSVDQASGTGTKTLSQIVAAANHRVRVERVSVSGDGTSAAHVPTQFELVIQDDAGTSSAGTVEKINEGDDETVQTTARDTFTGEPTTSSTVKKKRRIHPQGSWDFVFPPGRDLYIKGGTRLGVRCITPSQTNNWTIDWDLEE